MQRVRVHKSAQQQWREGRQARLVGMTIRKMKAERKASKRAVKASVRVTEAPTVSSGPSVWSTLFRWSCYVLATAVIWGVILLSLVLPQSREWGRAHMNGQWWTVMPAKVGAGVVLVASVVQLPWWAWIPIVGIIGFSLKREVTYQRRPKPDYAHIADLESQLESELPQV